MLYLTVKNFTTKSGLPKPTVERLAYLYTMLRRLEDPGLSVRLSSRALGELLSVPDHTIRKDLSLLKAALATEQVGSEGVFEGGTEQGYDVGSLRRIVESCLGLGLPRSACLVGLGRLGAAILGRNTGDGGYTLGYTLAAGFDSSVNRIELIRTDVPLFHSREMPRVIREGDIKIGIIAVPPRAAQDVADRLAEAGIRGIVNFAPVVLSMGARNILVRNVSLDGELHVLSAYLNLQGV